VQEVRWESSGTTPGGEYTFFYGKGNETHELGTSCFVHNTIISAVMRVEHVKDRMSYTIVLNVHNVTEDKIVYVKDSFYKELVPIFALFPKYHMNILLGDFNAEVGREDIFKPAIRNESLHEISNDNGVRVLNVSTSKNLTIKSTMFLQRNIHKYTWMFLDGKTSNQIDHILIDR
jgi:hypothetical protein